MLLVTKEGSAAAEHYEWMVVTSLQQGPVDSEHAEV